MTSPGMDIEPARVQQHGNMVDQVADGLDDTVSAAGYVRASNGSYGKLVGWLFTPPLNHFADTFLDKAKVMATDMQRQADALRATAAQATGADERAQHRFTGR